MADTAEGEDQELWFAAGFTQEEMENSRALGMSLERAQVWRAYQRGEIDIDTAAGIPAPSSLEDWLAAGFTQQDAEAWQSVGVDQADEAVELRDEEGPHSLETALRWKAVTDADAVWAFAWLAAGFTPEEAKPWIALGDDASEVEAETAIEWRDAGFSPEDFWLWFEALLWEDEIRPAVAQAYINDGLTTEALRAWCALGFDDTRDIAAWRNAGFELENDRGWIEGFQTEPDVARRWRDAEVPLEEALIWQELAEDLDGAQEWTAAGLSAAEAKQFQAAGVILAESAAEWKAAGFSPEQAGRLEDEGIFDAEEALAEGHVPDGAPAQQEQMYLLRPVATLAANTARILDSYQEWRRSKAPELAVREALRTVLSESDFQEVSDYFAGKWDDRAGEGDGQRMYQGLLDSCEALHKQARRMEARNARRPSMSLVDLVQDLATDEDLIGAFYLAVEKMDPDGAGRLVGSALAMIGETSSRAWTRTGRVVKAEQAMQILRRIERRAAEAHGIGSPQSLWCGAVAQGIQDSLGRR